MDFKSTPIGGIYRSLYDKYEFADRSPRSKELRDCELRANSLNATSLRVKTEAPSFFGRAKVRVAHQQNAADIVIRAVRDRNLWDHPIPKFEKLKRAEEQIKEYIKDKNAPLTLGDLSKLDQSIIKTVYSEDRLTRDDGEISEDGTIETRYPGDASARDSKRHGVPAAAAVPAALSLSSASASSSSTSWSARGGEFSRESLFLMQNSGANIISRRAAPASASSSLALDGYVRPELLLRDESSGLTSSDFETQT